ncbi:hypothetical protein LTR33_003094 [Friedmanniomyces endolithicus]|nr:hypothetical protein LTR33_003094 [Friedmanniomyces endolithicus]
MTAQGIAPSPAKRLRQESSRESDHYHLPPPTFDLDVWVNNYEGALLPLRLAHVAIHCPNLSRQAITLAISHAKKSKDVRVYVRLCDLAGQFGFADLGTPDLGWASKQEEGNKRELSRLEVSAWARKTFRAFLELEPHMRKAISLYTTAKYQACLDLLRRYYSDWSLDVFLGVPASSIGSASHVDVLFAHIREKSITAYFSSFSEVSLASLASTFPPISSSPTAMEEELLSMIDAGQLDARLDVVNGTLVAPRKDLRASTHEEARRAAEEVERTLLLRLHKVNVAMAGLEVPRSKTGGWEGHGQGNGLMY